MKNEENTAPLPLDSTRTQSGGIFKADNNNVKYI